MAKSSKSAGKKSSGKRTLIAPKGDKRYVKRDQKGRIKESDDQGKSLSRDLKQRSKNKVASGYGDQGDQPKKKSAAGKKKSAPAKKKSATAKKKSAPAKKKSAPAKKKSAIARKSAPKKA